MLWEAIDEGLKAILDQTPTQATYYHLEQRFALTRKRITSNPDSLAKGLSWMFYEGAQLLEKSILEALYAKLGVRFQEREGYRFIDYVEGAKGQYEYRRSLARVARRLAIRATAILLLTPLAVGLSV